MNNAFVRLWGIALIMWVVALLDWWGRRKYRQSKNRPAA
jgi:hypothetical protein